MIVGNGMIARQFVDREGVIIFASGVSNSQCKDEAEFERERDLLLSMPPGRLVYFSTTSIDFDSPYTRHKRSCEALVREYWRNHLIVRLPIVIGHSDNPHTLTNYLHRCIANGDYFALQSKARRQVLDVAELPAAVDMLQHFRGTVSLAHPVIYTVHDIVRELESIVGKPALYFETKTGKEYRAESISFSCGRDYLRQTLRKYYHDRRVPARSTTADVCGPDGSSGEAAHAGCRVPATD